MKKLLLLLITVVIVFAIFGVIYWQYKNIAVNKSIPDKNDAASDYVSPVVKTSVLGNPSLGEAVTNFLLSQQQFSWKTGEGSTNFCVFENLNPEIDLFPVYIWIRCGEFKAVSGELEELSGTSLPVKIDYPNELSYYDLKKFSFEAPRDGSLYDEDIKRIFPESIWPRLNHDGTFLNNKILEVAKESLLYN